MASAAALPPEVRGLLAQAAEYRLLGLLFEYPSDAWRAQVGALLPDLGDEALRSLGAAALEYSTPGLHTALFGPAGTVPVREVKWQGGVQFGYLMAEIAAFYQAFAYTPSAEEAGDHLAIQLGFISYLRLKQALALAEGQTEQAQLAAEAAAEFLKNHIAVSAEPVLRLLENFGPDYLVDAGRRILELAGPSPRSGYPLAIADELEEDAEMACGPGPQQGEDLINIDPASALGLG